MLFYSVQNMWHPIFQGVWKDTKPMWKDTKPMWEELSAALLWEGSETPHAGMAM
jgi:hypothetical protein